MTIETIKNFEEIDLELAQVYAGAWQLNIDLKAFFFHKNDIECVANEQAAIGVRFYMGIKDDGEKKCPDMMLVGVDENNEDLIKEEGENSGIYNFTLPCPRTCDNTSDLYIHTGPGSIGSAKCGLPNEGRTPSTPDVCNIKGYEIVASTAETSAQNWQNTFDLIAVLFDKDELITIFDELNVESMRVYFGIDEDERQRIILVGVDANGIDQTSSANDKLFVNEIPLCTKDNTTSCDTKSLLYTL